MATDATSEMTRAELLHFYLEKRLQRGDRNLPLDQILGDFPEYLRQRDAMRDLIHEADAAIAAGRSSQLDVELAIREVIEELAVEGITE